MVTGNWMASYKWFKIKHSFLCLVQLHLISFNISACQIHYIATYFPCGLTYPSDCSWIISYSPVIAFLCFSPHKGGFVKLHHKLHLIAFFMHHNLPEKQEIGHEELNNCWRFLNAKLGTFGIHFATSKTGDLNSSFRNHWLARCRNTM